MDPQQMVDGVNRLIDDINDGRQVIMIFTRSRRKRKTRKRGIRACSFFRGNPGAPFGVICPGEYKSNEDLIRAAHFILEHARELEVCPEDYAVGGESAGARITSNVCYGEAGVKRPDDPAAYFIIGGRDHLVRQRDVTDRYEEMRKAGVPAVCRVFPTAPHGFGIGMRDFWQSGPEESRHINLWLADNCFGDYYTRKGLNHAERELITFCFLAAQGGCEPQLTSHAAANMRNGNDKLFLIKIISHCLPFIGYPRSLNALTCVNKAAENNGN